MGMYPLKKVDMSSAGEPTCGAHVVMSHSRLHARHGPQIPALTPSPLTFPHIQQPLESTRIGPTDETNLPLQTLLCLGQEDS